MNTSMKKYTRNAVILVSLCASALLGGAMLQAQTVPTFTTNETVNVRSGDGKQYSIRATVNGVLTVNGRSNFDANRVCIGVAETDKDLWLRVDNNGVEGWVNLCAGDFEGSLSALPVVSPSNPVLTTSLVPTADYAEGNLLGETAPAGKSFIAFVRGKIVNVRELPSTQANKLGVLRISEGVSTAVYVTGRTADGYWAQVQYVHDDKTVVGWVARYLLSLPQDWTLSVDAK